MRLRDENKRRMIVETAVRMFSDRPFEKVRLEEVAAAAGVGKGTVYVYFKSKEELYRSLIYDGFAALVARLEEQLAESSLDFADKIRVIVRGLIDFSNRHPQLVEVMRMTGVPDANSEWAAKLRELQQLIAVVIRQAVEAGKVDDPMPELTALYFPAMIRAVILFGPKDIDAEELTRHVCNLMLNGIERNGNSQ